MASQTTTNTVEAVWDGGMRAQIATGAFSLTADEPAASGGTGRGPQPTEYLLAGLASCYTLALVFTARKRQMVLRDLSVTATGTYAGAGFGQLVLTVSTSLPREQLDALLQPALRVCYVTNTIKDAPPVEVRVS